MYKKFFSKFGVIVISVLVFLLLIMIAVFMRNSLVMGLINNFSGYSCRYIEGEPNSFNGPRVENCHWQWQCKYIDNNLGQNLCYMDIARVKHDVRICEKVDANSLKDACLKSTANE